MFSRGTRSEPRLPRRSLLTSQKNDVFELVGRTGFAPASFEWSEVETQYPRGALVDVIRFRDSKWFCAFGFNDGGLPFDPTRVTLISPGRTNNVEAIGSSEWTEQIGAVAQWLNNLRRETSQPNLWDVVADTPAIDDLAQADIPTDPLTREQQRWVEERIVIIRQYVRSITADPHTLARIEAKLDDLSKSSRRLGAKDFVNIALGVLMTIAAEAAMNSDQAKHLFELMFTGARQLLGG